MGKSSIHGGLSIAMFDYRRVFLSRTPSSGPPSLVFVGFLTCFRQGNSRTGNSAQSRLLQDK